MAMRLLRVDSGLTSPANLWHGRNSKWCWLLDRRADGGSSRLGCATTGQPPSDLNAPIVALVRHPVALAYWLVGADAASIPSVTPSSTDRPWYHAQRSDAGQRQTHSGAGYWCGQGRWRLRLGNAGFYGSTGSNSCPAPSWASPVRPMTADTGLWFGRRRVAFWRCAVPWG